MGVRVFCHVSCVSVAQYVKACTKQTNADQVWSILYALLCSALPCAALLCCTVLCSALLCFSALLLCSALLIMHIPDWELRADKHQWNEHVNTKNENTYMCYKLYVVFSFFNQLLSDSAHVNDQRQWVKEVRRQWWIYHECPEITQNLRPIQIDEWMSNWWMNSGTWYFELLHIF